MAGCDHDDTCYRVFCVTLLAIALTFTLILTDVFMDIDGLIRSHEKEKEQKTTTVIPEFEQISGVNIQIPSNDHDSPIVSDNGKVEPMYGDIKTIYNEEMEDVPYRTKRSLESISYQSELSNTNVQNIITTNLAGLFDPIKDRDPDKSKPNYIIKTSNENSNLVNYDSLSREKDNIEVKIETNKIEDDLLHLIMHDILLQGILGNMNLDEVTKKINTVVDNYDAVDGRKEIESAYQKQSNGENRRTFIQNKFYDELTHCKQLQTEIDKHTKRNLELNTANKEPKMFIKTVIDIQPLRKEVASDKKTVAKDLDSVIKLMYAGDSEKHNEINEKDDSASYEDQKKMPESESMTDNIYLNAFITDAIATYLGKHPNLISAATSKRLKRNVKVRKHPSSTHKPKVNVRKPNKTGDDELYVEIETHFDGKGIDGDRKRKLVKNIIEKIQKAIHNNLETIHVHDRKAKQFKIRRRVQNPLESIKENVLINKLIVPIDNFTQRDSAPLSKTNTAGNSPYVEDNVGDNWKKAYMGPHFLSGSKAINSAELGEINVHYDKVPNAIPQRLQVPLNAEETEDKFYELGNMKFYIKELDGTGFSIGFNQYLGEPPDEDSMKSFTGVDNLIKTYQSKYEDDVNNNANDKNENDNNANKAHNEKNNNLAELKKMQRVAELSDSDEGHELTKREVKRIKDGHFHKIYRRSTENNDYHSNEYKIIFNNNFLPYHTYQDIFTDKRNKYKKKVEWPFLKDFNISNEDLTTIDVDELPNVIDNNIINKNLKPSEILGLANLLSRKKRSIKKFTKINMSKLRYINTNMSPKRIFLKSKKLERRPKRQIDNIRIVTADGIHNMPLHRHSEENVLVVSNEDIFPNTRYTSQNEMELPENFEPIEKLEDTYAYGHIGNSMLLDPPRQPAYSNIFGGLSRHNTLMSKYPHVFMEEVSRSKEEEALVNNPYNIFNELNQEKQQQRNGMENPDDSSFSETSTDNPNSMYDIPTLPKVKEIVDAIVPKRNYKLTVRILPRNMSFNGYPSGFKEIHTSINKSISKNGLLISSLLNVSEISKVEKLNNKTDEYETATATGSPLVRLIKSQQEKMKNLLRQHKKKIDEQLDHLNKEKNNLENIIVDKHDRQPISILDSGAENIDVMLPSNPPQMLHLTKDEAGQLISSALMKLKETQKENKVTNAPPKNRAQPKATTQKPVDQEKMRIISTIQRNENLTNKILYKIDRNTEILQKFLQKFSDRMESQNIKRTEDSNNNRNENNYSNNFNNPPNNGFNNNINGFPNNGNFGNNPQNNGFNDNVNGFQNHGNNVNTPQNSGFNNNVNNFPNNVNIPMPYQTHWKDRIRDPFFKQTMPNLEVMKNDTQVSIPFVYAYQQPYPNNKPDSPVASVVYQGHIHTNAIRGPYIDPKIQYQQKIPQTVPYQENKLPYQPPKYQEKLPKLPTGNQTRFFIDGDVNDFKLAKGDYGSGSRANITKVT